MGFFLTILYLLTAYLSPETLFGPLAAFHIPLILAIILLAVSIPSFSGALIWKTPQSLGLIGLAFTVFLSILITGWAGGAVKVFLDFIPQVFAYFMICLHCRTKRKLQVLFAMLAFVCLFVTVQGYKDAKAHEYDLIVADEDKQPVATEYIFPQRSDNHEWMYRIKGRDFISDPNDFAQVIVCTIPFVFSFWKRGRLINNLLLVLIPVSGLLWGDYLTHSRGSVLALLALAIVAARRRIGTVPAFIVAGVLFLGASASHFTGGREISADSGAGRMDLWSAGLQLFLSHPILGIGINKLASYIGHTAHNTIVVCAAELGLTGLYFWSLFVFPTVRDALAISSGKNMVEAPPMEPEEPDSYLPEKEPTAPTKDEIQKLGRLVLLSLIGFFVAGWFLSRAFVMTLFLLGGVVEVIYEMADEQGMIGPRMPLGRAMRSAGAMAVSLPIFVYVVLRFGNLLR